MKDIGLNVEPSRAHSMTPYNSSWMLHHNDQYIDLSVSLCALKLLRDDVTPTKYIFSVTILEITKMYDKHAYWYASTCIILYM
jgi:hypothetical protein